jgi:hypothetical protein
MLPWQTTEFVIAASERERMAHETRLFEWAFALNWLVNAGTRGRDQKAGSVPYERFLPEGLRGQLGTPTKARKPTKTQLQAAEVKRLRELCLIEEETPALVADEQSQRLIADAKARLSALGKPWVPTADRGRKPKTAAPADSPDVLDALIVRAASTPTHVERD